MLGEHANERRCGENDKHEGAKGSFEFEYGFKFSGT
jgi:hypothetical protein